MEVRTFEKKIKRNQCMSLYKPNSDKIDRIDSINPVKNLHGESDFVERAEVLGEETCDMNILEFTRGRVHRSK